MSLARIIFQRFYEDRCMQIASSLTFTSLLAIVPMITVALTVITAFPVFGTMTAALQTFVLDNMMPASADVISMHTQEFTRNAARLTAVGIVFLFVTSIMLLLTIDRAFNDIFRVKRPRSIVQRIFVYWTLITIGPVLIGGSLSLTSWLVGQAVGLVRGLPGAGVTLLSVVPVVLTSIALSLLYAAMPNRRISARDAVLGGLLAGVVFEIAKRGFAFYIAQFPTYKLVYGAFATVPIFLLWIYVSWLVVIFGAVVVASLPEWRAGAGQAQPVPGSDFFDAMQILKLLWHGHHSGAVITLPQLLTATTVRIEQVENILETMLAAGWVGRSTAPNGWLLRRDPTTVTLEDVYHLFVFRGEAHTSSGGGDRDLDAHIHDLGTRMGENMRVTLDALFRGAEEQAALAADSQTLPAVQSIDARRERS